MAHYPWCFSPRFYRKPVCFFVRYLFQCGVGASIRQIFFLQIIEDTKINTFIQNLISNVNFFLSHSTKRVLGTGGNVGKDAPVDPAA